MLSGYRQYTVASSRDGRPSFVERANIPSAGGTPSGSRASGKSLGINLEGSMLEGMLDTNNEKAMRAIYRDMYLSDAIAGATVDIMSNLPFSDLTLSGMQDRKALEPFMRSIENLRLKSLLPGVSVDYLALGEFVGSMSWNASKRIFDGVMPQNLDNIDFKVVPVYGMDPIMDLKFPKEVIALLSDKDPRIQKVLANLPQRVRDGMRKGRVPLEPASTLHISRRSFSHETRGTSIFRRLLPIYLLEKALMRGTIEQSYRRQRSIMHIQAGDEEWEATPEEMKSLGGMFSDADMDPTNAVIVTRAGIMINDVKRGDDFWRYDSIYDFSSTAKMRALGINEAFLSGDANYNNMETSLSVFLDQLRSYRELVTRELFYEKMFPAIAVANGLKKSRRMMVTGDVQAHAQLQEIWSHLGTKIIKNRRGEFMALCSGDSVVDPNTVADITDYQIPVVEWHKQLKPEADAAYLELLDGLSQKGVPIPIRMMAAAGGLSIDEVINGQEEDLETRRRLQEYLNEIKGISPKDDKESEGEGESYARLTGEALHAVLASQSGFSMPRSNGLKHRQFDPDGAGQARNIAGGKRHILSAKGRKILDEKINKVTARVLANLGQKNNAEIRSGTK